MTATKVCTLSQPATFVNVWLYDPEVVIICPFQSYVSQVSIFDVPNDVSAIYSVYWNELSGQGKFPYAVNVNITYPFTISSGPGIYVVWMDRSFANVPPFAVPLVLLVHNV